MSNSSTACFTSIAPFADLECMSNVASLSQRPQSQVAVEASMKVAVKARDVAKQQGAAAVSLLESAAELSQALADEHGKGARLDVVG